MKPLIYYIAVTLDGFIASPNGGFDFFEMSGPHIPDHEAFVSGCSTVLMGRGTYDMAYKNGVVDPYPNLDTHVFSRSLGGSPHPNVKVHNNIDAESIREIKSQAPGNVWVCGGGKLASALISKGLVDNLIVKVNPVLIGHGLRLVDTLERPFKPKLENQKVYANGVVRLDYALGAGRVL